MCFEVNPDSSFSRIHRSFFLHPLKSDRSRLYCNNVHSWRLCYKNKWVPKSLHQNIRAGGGYFEEHKAFVNWSLSKRILWNQFEHTLYLTMHNIDQITVLKDLIIRSLHSKSHFSLVVLSVLFDINKMCPT